MSHKVYKYNDRNLRKPIPQ